MDLCSGNGIVPILMLARYPKASYTSLEIQPEMAAMARRSMQLNGIEDRITVLQGDLCDLPPQLVPHSFHVVTVNPPYMKTANPKLLNDTPAVQIARHEICCSLRDVMEAAAWLLMSKGRFLEVSFSASSTSSI